MADPPTTEWLLEGDPAVRWQVMRDLLDAPDDVVAEERARVATTGWGARLLAKQDPDGTWAHGLYSPKWTSTTYTLLLLRQLGLPEDDPRARRGCEVLVDGVRRFGGGLTLAKTVDEPETCITAMVVCLAATFGTVDDRVEAALAWLLDQQLADGGWNCETIRSGSRHGSFHTTIQTLEALHAWQLGCGADGAVADAADRGREFFADHRLYRSHRTGDVVDPRFTRLVFPPGWHHDVLRGLDHFQATDAPVDPRLGDAVATLQNRRRPDGTWTTNAPYAGRYWFRLEQPGQPSRINTLRALRVLRWWNGPTDAPRVQAPPDVDVGREWVPPMPRQPERIRVVLVSECAAADDADNYGASDRSVFDATTLEAFAAAGLPCSSVTELRERGIHLTVAIRHPKTAAGIRAATVKQFAPTLAAELALLPNVRVYLLMGDVAIAAINHIARTRTGRRVIPAGSTYRIRGGTYTLDGIRVLPSYLQAGPAWHIEAGKREMIAEDISTALRIAGIGACE